MQTAHITETTSLYARLGQEEGIAALVDDIVEAHMRNPAINARFLPYRDTPERLSAIKQHLCRFLGAGSGGPEEYTGRSMAEAHRGMNISEAEYLAALDDILDVLDKHGIDEQARRDILYIAYSLKGEITRT